MGGLLWVHVPFVVVVAEGLLFVVFLLWVMIACSSNFQLLPTSLLLVG